ncbi:MAG TPA: hypothetical protein VMU29_13150 [Smithella sp.]|nr:hypothetical protein [Smithella sp.]
MAKLSKDRLIFGLLLLVLIALGEIILGHFKLATWPAFMVMIFFFEAHMDTKKAANILVGGLFGIANLIIIKMFLQAVAPSLGLELAKLVYILVFVYLIVALGEVVPILFNNYCFMYFLVAAVAAMAPMSSPNVVFEWMGIEIVGGGLFILGILCIMKIMGALAAKAAKP